GCRWFDPSTGHEPVPGWVVASAWPADRDSAFRGGEPRACLIFSIAVRFLQIDNELVASRAHGATRAPIETAVTPDPGQTGARGVEKRQIDCGEVRGHRSENIDRDDPLLDRLCLESEEP